jgi:hypothetical protein
MSDVPLTPEEIEKNKEALRKRFQNQASLAREKKDSNKKNPALTALHNHPMYETLKNIDPAILSNSDSMNKMIETMASKFTNDSKQKKLYKKKVKDLLEQVKNEQKSKLKMEDKSKNNDNLKIISEDSNLDETVPDLIEVKEKE